MTMCKKDDTLLHQKSGFFTASKVVLSLNIHKESHKTFITEYISDVRFLYHKCNLLIRTVADHSIFAKNI